MERCCPLPPVSLPATMYIHTEVYIFCSFFTSFNPAACGVVLSPRRFCNAMRHYGAVTCGLSSKWWSEKHNLHHAFTNVVGVDEDIMVREQSRESRAEGQERGRDKREKGDGQGQREMRGRKGRGWL